MRYDNINLQEIFTPETYFISDHHFGHKFVTSFEPSRTTATMIDGYETQEEMLIARHNEVVKPDDIVVFLGDFSFNSPSNWASKLNGKKYLILGNHDRPTHQAYAQDFEYVFKGYHFDYNGYDLVFEDKFDGLLSAVNIMIENELYLFCHYPVGKLNEHDFKHEMMVTRNRKLLEVSGMETYEGVVIGFDYIIHGHVHSKSLPESAPWHQEYINVSCEVLDFRPKKLKDLIKGKYNESI